MVSKNIKNTKEILRNENRLIKDSFQRFHITKSTAENDDFTTDLCDRYQDSKYFDDILKVFRELHKRLNSFKSEDACLQLMLNCNSTMKNLIHMGKTYDELKNEVGIYRLRMSLARIER